ncbi:MAG: glycosyltransferase [Bacteroidales bacterium]|nr:glycosyltransferase [Bacteroidales bacterium]
MKISIVICLYNEEKNICPLMQELERAMQGYDFEVLMVDDGSVDQTVREIRKYRKPWVKLIQLRKNYGQSSALAAGIGVAKGDYIVTMDGDLQNDPADIPMMLKTIRSADIDMVAGYREQRKDNYIIRKIPSMLANYIIGKTTQIKIKDYGCTLKVFKSSVAKDLKLYGELHRFIPVLAFLEGATIIRQVSVHHHARKHGNSKYGIGRTFKVISDLLLLLFFKKYMQRPMHLFGTTGLILTAAGILINLYLFALKIAGNDIWGKPLMILGAILLLAGFQTITIGIITEMLMRTYYETQGKKPYRIKAIYQFETKDQKIHTDSWPVTV